MMNACAAAQDSALKADEVVADRIVSEYGHWLSKLVANGTIVDAPPFVVGLCGIPGAGKTTVAQKLRDTIHSKISGRQIDDETSADRLCLVLPMDGYHIPLKTLAKLPNAEELIYRRGSPETFDLARLRRDLDQLRKMSNMDETMSFPGFDHAAGDPSEDQYTYHRARHKVVIIEGLYILQDSIRPALDFSFFLDADVEKCIEALKVRNQDIPGYAPEEIRQRCETVDRQNALVVLGTRDKADYIVQGINA